MLLYSPHSSDRPDMVDSSTVVSSLLSLLVTNLTWSTPLDTINIIYYNITYCNNEDNTCSYETRSHPYLVLYVLPKTAYTVTITATNGVVTSDPSEEAVIFGAMDGELE